MMKTLFDLDNPVLEKLQPIADLVVVSIMWLVFSMPIVTIGAASSAMYYATVKVIRHKRETLSKAFLHSFKDNLKQGTIITLIFAAEVFLAIAYFNNFNTGMQRFGTAYLIAGIILVLSMGGMIPYAFPIISRFQTTIPNQLRYIAIMSSTNILTTLILAAMLIASIAIVYQFPFSLLIIPGVYTYLSSLLVERVFLKYTRNRAKEYSNGNLPWYLEQ